MDQQVKREPTNTEVCSMPVVESPSSTPPSTPAVTLPSSTNEQSTLTGAGFTSVMFERRERALYTSASSSNHLSSAACGGSNGHNVTGPQAGGSGVAPIPAGITAATALKAQTEQDPSQRFSLSKTHTYWWLEYASERGHFRFIRQLKKRAKSQPNPRHYKCAKCGWNINVFASNNELYSETDPAQKVDFDEGKTHSGDCAYAEPAAQGGQQHPQAAPNINAERDVADVQAYGTRNNGGVAANRAGLAVAPWVQNAQIFEETTRTYFRCEEVYLAVKKEQNGWK